MAVALPTSPTTPTTHSSTPSKAKASGLVMVMERGRILWFYSTVPVPQIILQVDTFIRTPLHSASINEHTNVVKLCTAEEFCRSCRRFMYAEKIHYPRQPSMESKELIALVFALLFPSVFHFPLY